MNYHFIKLIEVDGRQVALIDNGESDEDPERYVYEQVTMIDGVKVAVSMPLTEERGRLFFESYDQSLAERYMRMAQRLLEDQK